MRAIPQFTILLMFLAPAVGAQPVAIDGAALGATGFIFEGDEVYARGMDTPLEHPLCGETPSSFIVRLHLRYAEPGDLVMAGSIPLTYDTPTVFAHVNNPHDSCVSNFLIRGVEVSTFAIYEITKCQFLLHDGDNYVCAVGPVPPSCQPVDRLALIGPPGLGEALCMVAAHGR